MTQLRSIKTFLIIAIALCLSACSKERKSPPAVKVPEKPLIEIVHDAVKFYAGGGKTYPSPAGITIEKRKLTSGKSGDSVVIVGLQQRANSMATISFMLPAAWLAEDRQKLHGLEAEMKELTACAGRLSQEQGAGKNKNCRMEEVSMNGLPGITILSSGAPHITLTTVAVR